jgi:hypothetical protein
MVLMSVIPSLQDICPGKEEGESSEFTLPFPALASVTANPPD